ncbi:MAG: tyrosine--tRNA ligase [Candidatus Spechtbacteria bacterium RIFCSPLOWO2_02_FULL_38_8]|uniref:Tyrosine--tRNA ligase n=1 Tax=Candidatus Spechtbacteria bacterium RIFCSPLOWO2_02_FULL_38_8 TaxID=1802164 RepID=A0A1G2HLH5_9BACT|nr:MAG: tyrosine--tRNA ligase [Candidatus Spechtbacteria bacterium RIFCSPLOWO2_02_FULL_38_8]
MFTQKDILERGIEEIIDKESLKKKLKSGKKLRVKFGIDPTTSDIHLGHTVPLWKLRQFQDQGHRVILIIGDFTARIGDPSGQSKERTVLTKKQVEVNMKHYIKQVGKILNTEKLEVYCNSKWHGGKDGLELLLKLGRTITMEQLTKRSAYREAVQIREGGSVTEFLYPLFQGYDSVEIRADIEIGGTDQIFNLLMGRQVQQRFGQAPQDVITLPLLLGTDGVKKMSKSLGNYIAIQDKPSEMFGKIMSIQDNEIVKYFELVTPMPLEKVQGMKKLKITGKIARDLKIQLARTITELYWGEKEAEKAQKKFEVQFQKQGMPKDVLTHKASTNSILDLLVEVGFVKSKNEARQLIQQGGVYVDDKKMIDFGLIPKKPFTLRVGRRKIIKIL